MTYFDYAVMVILLVSLGMGIYRGLVSEVLAVLGWVAAFFLARAYAMWVGDHLLQRWLPQAELRYALGIVLVVLVTLILVNFARRLVTALMQSLGLGALDRLLGAVFGLMRGLLIVLIAVIVGGLTDWPQEPWWREAVLAPPLEATALKVKHWLPNDLVKKIQFDAPT